MHWGALLPSALLGSLLVFSAAFVVLDWACRPSYAVPSTGSIVLVTGAKRGIGLSAAKRLAREGFFVLASARTKEEVDNIDALNVENLRGIELDLFRPESDLARVESEIRRWSAKRGDAKLAAVVHNAISFGSFRQVQITNISDFNLVVQSGLVGVVALTKQLLPMLRESRGRVVGVSSGSSLIPDGGSSAYAATKSALNMFLACLRIEMLPHHVAVVNVVPGFIKTEIMDVESVKQFMLRQKANADVREHFPEIYESKEAKTEEYLKMVEKGVHTYDPGSTDDCIFQAITSPRPPLSLHASNMAGIPLWLLAAIVRVLPESALLRLLTM